MKFEAQKIIVKLEKDGSESVITFKEPLENERLQIAEMGRDKFRQCMQLIWKNCIDISGLVVGDQEITAEDIKAGNVPGSVADAIAIGYFQALRNPGESEAKNA